MTKIFLIFFSCALSLHAQNTWMQLTTPVKNNFKSLSVIDSLHLFAAGDSGKIIRSSNGGNNWSVLNFPSQLPIVDIYFSSYNFGWAITRNIGSPPLGSNIYLTTDAGETWNHSSRFFEDVFLSTLTFYDSLNGMCGSAAGELYKTEDGGLNWDAVEDTVVTGLPIYSLKYFSPQSILGSGGHIDFAGGIFSSHDSGINWMLKLVGPEPIQHLHIFDSLNIIGVGGDYEFGTGVVRSSDGGTTWNYRSLEFFGIAVAVDFRTRSDGWATLGFGKNFIHTTDSGSTWILIPTPNNLSIYDLAFADETIGYAVGDSGSVLKFNFNITDLNEARTTIGNFTLHQNFPNPFNPVTTIRFELVENEIVTLSLFDILGREKKSLITNEFYTAGSYQFILSIGNEELPSGIYFYKLTAGNFSATKKLAIIK